MTAGIWEGGFKKCLRDGLEQVPLPPIGTVAVRQPPTSSMTRSYANRLLAVLAALSFGLWWGGPVAHAMCVSVGSTSPDQCGTSGSTEHCDHDLGATSALCLTHHASQEALVEASPSPDTPGGGSVGVENEPAVPSAGTVVSFRHPGRHAVPSAGRLHLRVGVWLE